MAPRQVLWWKIPAQKALFWLYISHKIILWKKTYMVCLAQSLRDNLHPEAPEKPAVKWERKKEEDTLQKKSFILLSTVFLQHARPDSNTVTMCDSKCACVRMCENPVTQQNQAIDGLRWYIYALTHRNVGACWSVHVWRIGLLRWTIVIKNAHVSDHNRHNITLDINGFPHSFN